MLGKEMYYIKWPSITRLLYLFFYHQISLNGLKWIDCTLFYVKQEISLKKIFGGSQILAI